MAEKLIRIGNVSSVDYKKGMIKVTYPDRDHAVTDDLPVLSFNGEYKMPEIGKEVLVLHLSNGSAAGIVLGPYWNAVDNPPETGKGMYRKEFTGGAYEKTSQEGNYHLFAPSITFSCKAGSIKIEEIIRAYGRMKNLENEISMLKKQMLEKRV